MKINHLLDRLGFTEPMQKIFLTLIAKGEMTIAELARETGLYRPSVYKATALLMAKNLVSKTSRGKRTLYAAEEPSSLFSVLDSLKAELDEVVPELTASRQHHKTRPIIRYLEGKNGISHIYEDMMRTLKKDDVIYRYESPKDYKKNNRYYPALYWKRAGGKESEIQKYVITNEKTNLLRSPRLSRYSKSIPASFDLFEYDITELIYGDKVAFIDYNTETASIIESRTFAEFQRKIFKMLFRKI